MCVSTGLLAELSRIYRHRGALHFFSLEKTIIIMENTTRVAGEDEYDSKDTDNEGSASESGEYSGEEMMEFSAEFDSFPIVLACCIIAINLTVIILFFRYRSLKTVTNSFLVSLAASDLLAGLLGIPLYISCTVFGDNFCPPALLIWRFISVSTVLHILLVSVDRYIAIKYALRYHNIITRTVFIALTTVAWTSSAFVSLIQLSWRTNASMDEDEETNTAVIIYDLTIFAVFFVVPLCVMAFTYSRIFLTVQHHERQIWRYHSPSDPEHACAVHNSAQRKTAIIFLAMLIVFIVCWLPYFILSFQEEFVGDDDTLPAWVLYVFYYYTRFFTSLSNPLLYVLGKKDFREALIQAICLKNKARTEMNRASATLTALYRMQRSDGTVTLSI